MNSPASSEGPHEQAEELCQPQRWQPLKLDGVMLARDSVPNSVPVAISEFDQSS